MSEGTVYLLLLVGAIGAWVAVMACVFSGWQMRPAKAQRKETDLDRAEAGYARSLAGDFLRSRNVRLNQDWTLDRFVAALQTAFQLSSEFEAFSKAERIERIAQQIKAVTDQALVQGRPFPRDFAYRLAPWYV